MTSNKLFTLFLKPHDNTNLKGVLETIFKWSKDRSIDLQFVDSERKRIELIFDALPDNLLFRSRNDCLKNASLIISLGGDGTLLGICRSITEHIPPIFSINMGRLGFITEFTEQSYLSSLEDFLNGKYSTYELPLFDIEIVENETIIHRGAFINDAVIGRCNISRMLYLNVKTHGEKIFSLEGDGLIISSPIGSTAHSLSAGGPIVHPKVPALVLTAICPHTLSNRPIVVPNQFTLSVSTNGMNSPISLTLDGQESIELTDNQSLSISKCNIRQIEIIKNPERTYFGTLREKFSHGGRDY